MRPSDSTAPATAAANDVTTPFSRPNSAAGATPVYAGRAPDPAGARAVLDDIANRAEPLTFARAAREKCLRRDGKPRSVPFMHRAADPARSAHPLEYCTISGVRTTTREACLRWIARNSGAVPANSANWTPARGRQEHRAAEKQLAADGF